MLRFSSFSNRAMCARPKSRSAASRLCARHMKRDVVHFVSWVASPGNLVVELEELVRSALPTRARAECAPGVIAIRHGAANRGRYPACCGCFRCVAVCRAGSARFRALGKFRLANLLVQDTDRVRENLCEIPVRIRVPHQRLKFEELAVHLLAVTKADLHAVVPSRRSGNRRLRQKFFRRGVPINNRRPFLANHRPALDPRPALDHRDRVRHG